MTDTPPPDGPDRPEELPGIIGHYEPFRKIGEGAMGNVYVAVDLDIPGRHVALKILKTDGIRQSVSRMVSLKEISALDAEPGNTELGNF